MIISQNNISSVSRRVIALCLLAAMACLICLPSALRAEPANKPPEEITLPEGEGRDEVEAYCSACHSLQIVVQQKGLTRERWDELLDWMVEEQGMAALDEEDHKLVLNYLSEYLGPQKE